MNDYLVENLMQQRNVEIEANARNYWQWSTLKKENLLLAVNSEGRRSVDRLPLAHY
ncbi:hypothetical protein ACFFSY_22135 [Paenibacillus aurantiacus]|uniref:Uncharacterized protein n=1 Tax=Paenibacillus aurantiacus TaxID=1936118 RepID=A0ABV5KTU3_9BACL